MICLERGAEKPIIEDEGDVHNFGVHTQDDLNKPDGEGRVLVNVGHPPDEDDIFLTPQLARAAKPHQVGGIRFLYDNVVENLDQYSTSPGFGCILAHSMGLGKTFQICAFSEVFLRNTKAKTVLIIVPINTIQNWVSEFNSWLPPVIPTDHNHDDPVHPRSFHLHVLNDNTKDFNSRSRVNVSFICYVTNTIIFLLFAVGDSRLDESRRCSSHRLRDVPTISHAARKQGQKAPTEKEEDV